MADVVRNRVAGVRQQRTWMRRGTRMRRVRLAAMVLAVAGLAAACSGGGSPVDATGGGGFNFVQQSAGKDFVAAGNRHEAPKLAGKNLDGAELDVASLRGKIVVVNFWASWCAPCRAETPGLVQLSKENPTVAFLGVNEKDPSGAKAFVRDNGVPYPSIVDRLGTLAAGWPVAPGLPSTFVLDADGRIAARFTGPVVPEDDLKPVLTRLQAEA
ncbi:TlpA disulfide reductase family protein [Frankia sp. QA3]|uniref:TlpA family protein disulfide reductase n=1 Tax=Frankia sp. QA3 TaxID=710111 RepID=UPI000269C920|nr:thiol-disulfide isomerase-like thioredoxin [Frankia sp. QA3]